MLKNSTFAAVFSTAYLILLVILVVAGYEDSAALVLILSPLLIIWLVYIVLCYGEAPARTSEGYFYENVDMRAEKLRR